MFISDSPAQTAAAGAACARGALRGDVFALTGDLGAGKTQFVKGFVTEMGSDAEATSPTFTLVHEYGGGRLPVYHFDFYRLANSAELARLGLDDYLFGDGVCLIEWADRFAETLPSSTRWIRLQARGETERVIDGVEPE